MSICEHKGTTFFNRTKIDSHFRREKAHIKRFDLIFTRSLVEKVEFFSKFVNRWERKQ